MKIKNKLHLKNTLLLTVIILLSACGTYTKPQKGNPAISDMNKSLQEAYITDRNIAQKQRTHSYDFMPPLGKAEKNEQRFDVTANDIPAKDFFMGLVKDTPYNMVVSPKIEGVVTLNLRQVTVPEVLQAAKDNYGYQFKRTLYGYEVHPASLETRTFTVNYLDMSRHGKSSMSVSSGQITQKTTSNANTGGAAQGNTGSDTTKSITPVSSVETTSKSDFWKQLLDTVKAIVGDKAGREVVVNPASGMVFVRAYPDELDAVGKYLDSMQETMTRQVIIEAKVMEVILNDEYQAGINWTALGIKQNGLQAFASSSSGLSDLTAPNIASATAAGGIFTIAAKSKSAFSALISLLSTQGNVQVLSSPRIATLNNQKAIIKVGQDDFFITNVVNTTVTGTSTQNSQNVELTPFFSGISLDVTPEIDQNNKVILHIHPMISTVTQHNMQYTIGGASANGSNTSTLPLAQSSIRESDNIVSAENGQIVVIGGLMTNVMQENTANTPGLSKAPIIGSLFRRTHQTSQKAELVILLRPIVVNNNTWTKEARDAEIRMRDVNRGFHYGTAPEVFGNKAEQDIKTR